MHDLTQWPSFSSDSAFQELAKPFIASKVYQDVNPSPRGKPKSHKNVLGTSKWQ